MANELETFEFGYSSTDPDKIKIVARPISRIREDLSWSLEKHQSRNRAIFDINFPRRSVDPEGIVLWPDTRGEELHMLEARFLRSHRLLNPVIYRQEGVFRRSDLSGFIRLCRSQRGEDLDAEDPDWEETKKRVMQYGILEHYQRALVNKTSLNMWFCSLLSLVVDFRFIGMNHGTRLGLKGALAADELGAGYIGDADVVIPIGTKSFAALSFKLTWSKRDSLWYKPDSLLARIFCWLSGTAEMRVGLVLCNLGFKLLYRLPDGFGADGSAIFQYYIYSPEDEPWTYQACRGDTGIRNLDVLVRIAYELAKVSADDPKVYKCVAPPAERRRRRRKMTDEDPKLVTEEVDDKEDLELSDEWAEKEPVYRISSSYRFSARLGDESLMRLEGLEFDTV